MAMPRALVTSAPVGEESCLKDGPAHDAAGVGVEHGAAVDLALSGGVLGDVGDPELVRPGAGELALDAVAGDVVGLDLFPFPPPGQALQARAAHQQLDAELTLGRGVLVGDHQVRIRRPL